MIKKIISGGQTGTDQGALDFALENEMDAGGWCPRGRICESGIIPARYPLVEVCEDDYNLRTRLNVRDSQGTLVIIRDGYLEEGTHLTIESCKAMAKPYFLVDLHIMSNQLESVTSALANWFEENQITVLNVAGNRESASPGIQEETTGLLKKVLEVLTHQPGSDF